METYPIIIDGREVDTGRYVLFPDMDAVVVDPGLAISLQLSQSRRSERIIFSHFPWLIPKNSPEMRYLRDYRRYHGIPQHTKDELDEATYARVCLSRESDIREAIAAGVRDHHKLFNPFRMKDMGVTLDERIDALYEAGLEVKREFQRVREVSVKEGVPIKTFEWTWTMFTEYLERQTFQLWGEELDVVEAPGRDGGKNYRFREPYGVACLFTPYNSPLALGILSITSSILAGNSTILKPPSKVPLSTILLAQMFMRKFLDMGLPRAMLQVLTGGGKSMMERFLSDPHVGALVWYGDSETGIELWADAVRHRIQMAPELAGSDASLVWGRDLDLEFVAKMVVKGRFLGSGQACMAVKRLLVQDSLHDELLRLIVDEVHKLHIGRPSDPNCSLPPLGLTAMYLLIDQMQDALSKGAKIVTGGRRCDYLEEDDPAGLFFTPTVLTDVTTDMHVMTEEVFAPVLPVMQVKSVDEALAIANASSFGLRSSIFTDDPLVRARWIKEIEAAGVNVNQDHLYFDPHMPHLGGYKNSGIIGAKYFPVMLTRMKYVHTGPGVSLT